MRRRFSGHESRLIQNDIQRERKIRPGASRSLYVVSRARYNPLTGLFPAHKLFHRGRMAQPLHYPQIGVLSTSPAVAIPRPYDPHDPHRLRRCHARACWPRPVSRGSPSPFPSVLMNRSNRNLLWGGFFAAIPLLAACNPATPRDSDTSTPPNPTIERAESLADAINKDDTLGVRQKVGEPNVLTLTDADQRQVLHLAAQRGNRTVINTLIGAGADVNKSGPDNGLTPLMIASHEGHVAAIEALIKGGAQVNLRGPAQQTALGMAVKEKKEEAVAALLAMGANATTLNAEGVSVLCDAVIDEQASIARALVAAGESPTVQCKGKTAQALAGTNTLLVDALATPRTKKTPE